jgi:hypothetical protein
MNTNRLRKNYENLSMFQRLALADNALARNDESETMAIKAASPKIGYSCSDFWETLEKIQNIRLTNLIVRLGYMMQFDFFMTCELEKLIDRSVSPNDKHLNKDLRMAAFLYVRATDSWDTLNREMSLQPSFDESLCSLLLSFELFQAKDSVMRAYAYSEDEARKNIVERTGDERFATVRDEIKALKEYLEIK